MPFGDDANDLPVREIQTEFNELLMTLLQPQVQKTPTYNHNGSEPFVKRIKDGQFSHTLKSAAVAQKNP